MLYLTIASLVVAVIAVGIAIKQTNIARQMAAKQDDQEKEIDEWQRKHEAVAIQLARINPNELVRVPNHNSFSALYPALFSDPRLRQAIETYIVELADNRSRLVPRKPSPHELRSPALRETVTKAAAFLDACRRENPTIARHFME